MMRATQQSTQQSTSLGLSRILSILAVLATFGLPVFPPALQAQPAPQLSLEEILARHAEARGGDKALAVQSMKLTGRSVAMGMEAPFVRWQKRPGKILLEIYVMDMTGVQAYDGETAWWYMPFMGHAAAEVMPADMARTVVNSADFDGPLVHSEHKGHEVELEGVEAVNGVDCYKLKVVLSSGDIQTHYIDAETFLTARIQSPEQDVAFKDYATVNGLPVPLTIEIMGAMGEQFIYVDEVEYDVHIDDKRFSMR